MISASYLVYMLCVVFTFESNVRIHARLSVSKSHMRLEVCMAAFTLTHVF